MTGGGFSATPTLPAVDLLQETSSEPSALSRGEARRRRRAFRAPLTGLKARKTKLGKRSTAQPADKSTGTSGGRAEMGIE